MINENSIIYKKCANIFMGDLFMLKVFTSPSCSSCRKVKKWLTEQEIPFVEHNFLAKPLTDNDIKDILMKSENGTDDIISTRSNAFKEAGKDFESMSLKELIQFIKDNPTVIKRPIIVNDRRIQVGYDEEEIRSFIPEARRIASFHCSSLCENYDTCDHRYID